MKPVAATVAVVALLAGCAQSGTDPQRVFEPEQASYSGIYDDPVRLSGGQFLGAPFDAGGASRPQVTLLPQPRWQMDLDGDGDNERIVLLRESSGGSGGFIYLAVTGLTDASGSVDPPVVPAYLLGDRIEVQVVILGADGRLKVVVEPGAVPIGVTSPHVREFQLTDHAIVPLTRISGMLTYAHEVRQLIRCGNDEALWVSEAKHGVVAGYFNPPTGDPYQARFASVLGRITAAPDAEFAVDFDRQVVVSEVQRLENEGHGCALELGDAAFRASGEEPFWSLEVFADRVEYHTIGTDTVTFRLDSDEVNPSWGAREGVLSARFKAEDADGRGLNLDLRSASCQDTMAGNRYAWQARLSLAGQSLTGCAISAATADQ